MVYRFAAFSHSLGRQQTDPPAAAGQKRTKWRVTRLETEIKSAYVDVICQTGWCPRISNPAALEHDYLFGNLQRIDRVLLDEQYSSSSGRDLAYRFKYF